MGLRTGNDLAVAIPSVRVDKDGNQNESYPKADNSSDKQQWISEHN
jgi:hypothetical protein